MRIWTTYLILAILLATTSSPVSSEWGWYRGDIATFSAEKTSTSVAESVHRAAEAGLDWVVLSAPPGSGNFVGLSEIIEEIKLTVPRITPVLGSGWRDGRTTLRILGIDSRAPVPARLTDLLTTVNAHKGVAVLTGFPDSLLQDHRVSIYSPTSPEQWADAVTPGGAWDRALTNGRRLFITGTSLAMAPAQTHETTVWAEGNQPDQVIAALRRGSAFVSDAGGIQLDLQVNGHTFGHTVFHEGEPFVRIRAHSRDPIDSVSLIADGVEIWSAQPGTTAWEERFFLPAKDFSYVRAVLYAEAGRRYTIGNPIFLVAENAAEGELPLVGDPQLSTDDLLELGGVLEALPGLETDAQSRVIREFLSSPATRYSTCWLLQNRADIIGDKLLSDLAGNDADIQVRLGAAYALVTRTSELAPDVLYQFLDTPSPDLQRYAARMFAHYTQGFTSEDWSWDNQRSPDANAFLIRAYHPVRNVPQHTKLILSLLDSEHDALADAASDKLVDLGTRSYSVIEALVDAATEGAPAAADVLGIIGDHRTITPLREILENSTSPGLARSAFLALTGMGAPYPDRRSIELATLANAPRLDGSITDDEWSGATDLADLRSDWDGARSGARVRVRAGKRADSAYIAVQHPARKLPIATLTDTPDTTSDEDRIEISLAYAPDGHRSGLPGIDLIVNSFGLVESNDGVPCDVVSRVSLTTWEIEVALPLEILRRYPRFNLSLLSVETSTRLTWSVTYGAPDDPSRYGDIYTDEGRHE